MSPMERNNGSFEQKMHIVKREAPLPQSESEWLATNVFTIETVETSNNNKIRCAFSEGAKGGSLVTMVGGLPRDPLRREKLPLINKLYGDLALKLSGVNESSVLYNQPGTGGSTGEWEKDTLTTRSKVCAEVSQHFYEKVGAKSLAIIGTSAGGYMAVRSLDELQKSGVAVSKLVLLSPAAYPEDAEEIPYGEKFSAAIRSSWDVASSPVFPALRKFVTEGGSVLVTFFEYDNPPIPLHIQEYYRSFVKELAESGGKAEIAIIARVAHNFRKVDTKEGDNLVDNSSIRKAGAMIASFLAKD